jgi:hypothetical protein
MSVKYKKIAIIFGVLGIVIITGIVVLTYFVRVDSPLIMNLRKVLHMPAIVVDNHNISIAEIEENTNSIKQFYENQDFSSLGIRIDFDTEDGQKRLKIEEKKMINKLIEDIAIAELADEWGIEISDEAVKVAMERPMNEMGTENEVKEKLQNLYGWSLDDFGQKVVKKQLFRERVQAEFQKQNPVTDEMRAQMNKAQKELEDGRVFADVAQKYSQAVTASSGGVVGWIEDNQLQDEIGQKVKKMQKGEYSEPIETELGLHIVHVDDITEVDGRTLRHLSQIMIKKQTFADYINEKIKGMNVKIFIPGYVWDIQKAMVVFSDPVMEEFEQKVLQEEQLQQQNTQTSKEEIQDEKNNENE